MSFMDLRFDPVQPLSFLLDGYILHFCIVGLCSDSQKVQLIFKKKEICVSFGRVVIIIQS